jgi:hypothetical protein
VKCEYAVRSKRSAQSIDFLRAQANRFSPSTHCSTLDSNSFTCVLSRSFSPVNCPFSCSRRSLVCLRACSFGNFLLLQGGIGCNGSTQSNAHVRGWMRLDHHGSDRCRDWCVEREELAVSPVHSSPAVSHYYLHVTAAAPATIFSLVVFSLMSCNGAGSPSTVNSPLL